MKQQIATLILIAVAATGARAAQARTSISSAQVCPKSGKTWVCSEAETKVNAAEAVVIDEVTVEAQFSGPNYYALLEDSSDVLLAFPSTWKAKVKFDKSCAYSGLHHAEAIHRYWVDDPDLPPLPIFNDLSSDDYFRAFCDCGGSPP